MYEGFSRDWLCKSKEAIQLHEMQTKNTWRNCLFLRNMRGQLRYTPVAPENVAGRDKNDVDVFQWAI